MIKSSIFCDLEKISRQTCNREKTEGGLYGYNPDLQDLINFLIDQRGFGQNIERKWPSSNKLDDGSSSLVEFMYSSESPNRVETGSQKTEKTKRSTWGVNRLTYVLRTGGDEGLTFSEAEYIYRAFLNVFGKPVGNVITRDQLVKKPLADVLNRLTQLAFIAETQSCSIALKAIAATHSYGLSIKLQAWATKLGSSNRTNLENLVSDDSALTLPVGYEYLIAAKGIAKPDSKKIFIFETSDNPMKVEGHEEFKEIFASGVFEPQNSIESIDANFDHDQTAPFKILPYAGYFNYFALCFPKSWDFEEVFGISSKSAQWNSAQSKKFLKNLMKQLTNENESIQFTGVRYRVEL